MKRVEGPNHILPHVPSEKPRQKIAMMRDVMKHQLLSDKEVANIFNGEWGIVKTSGILDTIMPLRVNKRWRRIIISAMYKYYSLVNRGGMRHTLEYIELFKFITKTGILSNKHSNNVICIFINSICTKIARHEFLVAMIRLLSIKTSLYQKSS